jgi:hypothetical protein
MGMVTPSSGLSRWFREHRAQYNRWADRHTVLIWGTLAVLLASLLIVTAGRLSHPAPQVPDISSSPVAGQGRLP